MKKTKIFVSLFAVVALTALTSCDNSNEITTKEKDTATETETETESIVETTNNETEEDTGDNPDPIETEEIIEYLPYSDTIEIDEYNGAILNATWYYFTENGASETASGSWWYYDGDVIKEVENA